MSNQNYISADSSILYRCNQKYFDKVLAQYDLGYTLMLLLIQINEHNNITMNELVISGAYDKGTITKAIQKLESLKYVKLTSSKEDKRSKLISLTEKSQEIMPKLYQLKSDWISYLSGNIDEEALNTYFAVQEKIVEKVREYARLDERKQTLRIYGLQKLTLLDYPEKVAATIFTGGCNFKCPFCHNRSLVFLNENDSEMDSNEILNFLDSRKNVLDGVCISGGEPLLQDGLKEFIIEIRKLGLKVKLDTNGSNFEKLKELVEEGLLDYVAMDIKNCSKNYLETIGLAKCDLSDIEKSKNYLLENHVDYEFRTTIVKDFHDLKKIEALAKEISGAKRYYLQNFEDKGTCIQEGLQPVSIETLEKMKEVCKKYIEHVQIRGVKE